MYYTRLQVVCDPNFRKYSWPKSRKPVSIPSWKQKKDLRPIRKTQIRRSPTGFHSKKISPRQSIDFFQDKIQKKNWNEEWEKNLQPIVVDDRCLIRAEFHQINKKYDYEIIITPKMSFGTGHHQTTYLMVRNQMKLDHRNKRVMDAGCGTAILSIMASKLGAREVEAFDIDEWSVINGQENIENNHCTNIHLKQGKVGDMKFKGVFDIVLANINKNVLLDEIKLYATLLTKGGHLMLSGFYDLDRKELALEAARNGMKEESKDLRETWALLLLKKSNNRWQVGVTQPPLHRPLY